MGSLPRGAVRNLLVNVPVNARNENTVIKTQKMLGHFKSKVCMLDSGGFTILKGEEKGKQLSFDSTRPLIISPKNVNIAPCHVVQAAVSLQPNIFVALDYPIRKIKNPKDQRIEFKKKLPYNIAWAVETARLRKKYTPDIELLLPAQCYTLRQFLEFKKGIEGISFDGFSIPIRNSNLQEVTRFLLEFSKINCRMVHILGSSAILTIALAAWFSHHHFDLVSIDSGTPIITARQSIYLNRRNLSRVSLKDDHLEDKDRIREMCHCPVCRNFSLIDLKESPYKERSFFLGTHNLHAIEGVCRDLHKNSNDLVSLERFLKTRAIKARKIDELIRCLELKGPKRR